MRPKHLKVPFNWQERRVTIVDRVWYVPKQCEDKTFVFPGWVHDQTFAVEQPLNIEYCSGNGDWIVAKALANPHENWIAVEKKFERVRKIWAKLKNFEIPNLLIICGEGYKVTEQYFTPNSIQSIYVNFPDPWPKNMHAKHRLIQPNFIIQMSRILNTDGTFTLATDDEAYSHRSIKELQQSGSFTSLIADPFYCHEMSDYKISFFEDLWRKQGKQIRYHIFKKIN